MSPRGLVLDMDGTLVNTEPLSMHSWNSVFAEHGVPPLVHRDYDRFIGVSSVETARTILSEHAAANDKPAPDESLVALLTDSKRTLLARTLLELTPPQVDELWFTGVRPLIAQLHVTAGVRLALCTSSDAQQAAALMDRETHGVGSTALALRVTRDDVPPEQMKPRPAPYLRAAELLGLPPEDCIAVEDSASGVASAAAAKYGHVLGVLPTGAEGDTAAELSLKTAGATQVFIRTEHALDWVLGHITTVST
eukprot:Hpha_TRINITY_DN32_c0_g1::TRINITY_DN32_c0_g1_i1::g.110211::m.110211